MDETTKFVIDSNPPQEVLRLEKGDGFWVANGAVLTFEGKTNSKFMFTSDDGEMIRVENTDGGLHINGEPTSGRSPFR